MKITTKLISFIYITCLICALIFTSCDHSNEPQAPNDTQQNESNGNENVENNDDEGKVTAEEWASIFSKIPENIESKTTLDDGTAYISIKCDGISYTCSVFNGVKSNETYYERNYYYIVDGVNVTKYAFSDDVYVVEEVANTHFSFDQFTYDSESKSYKANAISVTSEDGSQFEYTNIEVKFVNGQLVYTHSLYFK